MGSSFLDIIWKLGRKCTNYLQYFNVKMSNIKLLFKFSTIWTLFKLLKTKLFQYLDASCSVFFDLNSIHAPVLECPLCDMSVMWSLIWLEAFYENLKNYIVIYLVPENYFHNSFHLFLMFYYQTIYFYHYFKIVVKNFQSKE